MTGRVNSEMVRLARESRGLTQGDLAKDTDIHQGTISKLEIGTMDISADKLQKIADRLAYPLSFFFLDERYTGLGLSVLFYRKKASTLIKHMRQIEAKLNIYRIHAKALLRDVSLDTPNEFRAIDIDQVDRDAVAVAQMTRAVWRLPSGPVKNLVAVIESAGGLVFKFPFGTSDIDAISQWPDDSPPMFFINSSADADRARFSLAHELGHMVMHQQISETMEDEANRFAAEFLMPAKDIRQDLFGMSLERAANLKPFWRVSMASIVKRSHDLGCMTGERYSSLFAYMGRLGFRRREPNQIAAEEPKLIQKLVEAHIQQNHFGKIDFARMLHLCEEEVEQMYLRPKDTLRLAV